MKSIFTFSGSRLNEVFEDSRFISVILYHPSPPSYETFPYPGDTHSSLKSQRYSSEAEPDFKYIVIVSLFSKLLLNFISKNLFFETSKFSPSFEFTLDVLSEASK